MLCWSLVSDSLKSFLLKVLRGTFGPLGTVSFLLLGAFFAASDDLQDQVLLLIFTSTWQGLAVWSVVFLALTAEVLNARQRTEQMRIASTRNEAELREMHRLIGSGGDNADRAKDVDVLGDGAD